MQLRFAPYKRLKERLCYQVISALCSTITRSIRYAHRVERLTFTFFPPCYSSLLTSHPNEERRNPSKRSPARGSCRSRPRRVSLNQPPPRPPRATPRVAAAAVCTTALLRRASPAAAVTVCLSTTSSVAQASRLCPASLKAGEAVACPCTSCGRQGATAWAGSVSPTGSMEP